MTVLNQLKMVDLSNETEELSFEAFADPPEFLMRNRSTVWRSQGLIEGRNTNSTAGQEIGDPQASFEGYAVFLVSGYQYIVLVIIFSRGAPYRQPLRTNYGLLIAIVTNIAFLTMMIFYPPAFLIKFFEMMEPPKAPEEEAESGMQFRLLIFAIIALNFVVSVFVEKFVLERGWICAKTEPSIKQIAKDKEAKKSRSARIWDKITFTPTEYKKFQYYDQVIGSQVAPLIWRAVLDSAPQSNGIITK